MASALFPNHTVPICIVPKCSNKSVAANLNAGCYGIKKIKMKKAKIVLKYKGQHWQQVPCK